MPGCFDTQRHYLAIFMFSFARTMGTAHPIRTILLVSCIFYHVQDVQCFTPILSGIAGHALGTIDRITTDVADKISDVVDPNREVKYLPKDGVIHGLYKRHRERHRERLTKLCEYFRRGRLHRRPCRQGEGGDGGGYDEGRGGRDYDGGYNTGEYNSDNNYGQNNQYTHGHRNRDRYQRPPRPGPRPGPGPRPRPVIYPDDNDDKSKPCRTSDGLEGRCETAAYCFSQYNDMNEYQENRCDLANGGPGVCCPVKAVRKTGDYLPVRIPAPYQPSAKIKHISLQDIDQAAEESFKIVANFVEEERKLIAKGVFQRHGSTQSQHQAFFGPFDQNQLKLGKGGFINLLTTIKIKEKFKLTNEQARDGLWKYSLENTELEKFCIKEPECHQSKYRTADGSCNNLQRPLWGKSNTGFTRLVPPAYADGLSLPRVSVAGKPLPNARYVSLNAATDKNLNDQKFTLFVMQWGQFIDHDLTLSANTRATTGEGLICCSQGEARTGITRIDHPSCFPIPIAADDPFYSKHGQRCMNFVRNLPVPRANCALGHREQMNTLTHIIDGSMVYGSDEERQNHLREHRGGRLRISTVNGVQFLPFDTHNRSDECAVPERDARRVRCFVGGDVRVNEQTGLTMIHNLLLREHNRVADELLKLNPNWDDEITFQEARRIVAAEIQHITYNEWSPLIIGRTTMKAFNILPKSYGFIKDYDSKVNPNIINAFATAAYRFHTLIQGFIDLLDNRGRRTEQLQLRNLFNNPTSLYRRGAYDEYLNGYVAEPTQTFDKHFTQELTEHLFQEHGTHFGMDLIALNIQRGREHGLPGYNEFRKVCGMSPIKSFDELDKVLQPGSAQTLSKLYQSVDDIDLFIAGNHERRIPDAVVGPTFACILAEQQRRNKIGDRFWYENGDMAHSFNAEQLHEIRKASLARMICDNSDNIESIQPLAFLQPINWNKKVACDKLGKVNLNLWKGERIWKN